MVSKLDTLLDMFACARDFDLDADYLAQMNAQADIISLYMSDDDNWGFLLEVLCGVNFYIDTTWELEISISN